MASAASESSATIQRHAVGVDESMPNARPGFMTSVREKKPSTTVTGDARQRDARSATALDS